MCQKELKENIYKCEGITYKHIKEVHVLCDYIVKIQYLKPLTHVRKPYS